MTLHRLDAVDETTSLDGLATPVVFTAGTRPTTGATTTTIVDRVIYEPLQDQPSPSLFLCLKSVFQGEAASLAASEAPADLVRENPPSGGRGRVASKELGTREMPRQRLQKRDPVISHTVSHSMFENLLPGVATFWCPAPHSPLFWFGPVHGLPSCIPWQCQHSDD